MLNLRRGEAETFNSCMTVADQHFPPGVRSDLREVQTVQVHSCPS